MEELLEHPATTGLILANIVASIAAFQNRTFLEQNLFVVGPILRRAEYHRLVTSGFLHGGFGHLAVNLITLFYFGPYLEGRLGLGLYLLVYFASLLGGSLWSLMEHRRQLNYAALGASGAISGVLISFCLFEPLAMLGVFFIIPMPAILFAVLYIALSAYLSTLPSHGIGHDAHLGGAIVGGVVTVVARPDAWTSFTDALARLFI